MADRNLSPDSGSLFGVYGRGPGLASVGSYQVAGKPFLTGNLDLDNGIEDRIIFPNVTKRIVIQNMADVDLRVHFATTASTSVNDTSCFWTLPTTKDKIELNVKCKEIYISNPTANNGKYELYAELTGIGVEQMFALTGSGISGAT